MDSGRIAAFFDFDRTLIAEESGKMGFRWMLDQRMILPGFMIKVLVSSLFYRLNLLSEERMVRVMLSFYRNRRLEEFQPGSRDFYREYLRPHLAPAIVARLEEHREKGHLLVLVSGSLRYLLEPAAEDLGFDLLLCTDLEVDADGFLTGNPEGPVCVQDNKRQATLKIAEQHGLDLGRSYAYGDHHADIPLLESVGYPHAVEPSGTLEKVARERGWPILRYR